MALLNPVLKPLAALYNNNKNLTGTLMLNAIRKLIPIVLCTAFLVQAHSPHHQHHSFFHAKQTAKVNSSNTASLGKVSAASTNSDVVINSSYLFDGSLADEAEAYDITLVGGEQTYVDSESTQALQLIGESYLELPLQMSQDIQLDKSLYISVDFMLPDTGVDESARVIFSNKDWAYDVWGLKLTAYNEKIEWQPAGTFYVEFNIGVGISEIATRFFELQMNTWYTATVELDFEQSTVGFGINGRVDNLSLKENIVGNSIDPSDFINWIGQTPLRVGAHYSIDGQAPPWRDDSSIAGGNTTTTNIADAYIDNLIVRSPRPDGDTEVIKSSLEALTAHLTSSATLTEASINEHLLLLRENLTNVDFTLFASEAKTFINAHSNRYGALYKIKYRSNSDNVRYDDLPDISKAYVDLGVWMLESGLTNSNAASAAGITLIEHTEFPGAISDSATRITAGEADIKAEFVPNSRLLYGRYESTTRIGA